MFLVKIKLSDCNARRKIQKLDQQITKNQKKYSSVVDKGNIKKKNDRWTCKRKVGSDKSEGKVLGF